MREHNSALTNSLPQCLALSTAKMGKLTLTWACECQCLLPLLLDNQLRSRLVSMTAMLMKEGQYIMIFLKKFIKPFLSQGLPSAAQQHPFIHPFIQQMLCVRHWAGVWIQQYILSLEVQCRTFRLWDFCEGKVQDVRGSVMVYLTQARTVRGI